MKRYLLLVAFATVFLGGAPSEQNSAVSIPILNPQFDVDELPCAPGASCNELGITGWLVGPQTWVLKASTVQYPKAPSEGLNLAAVGGPSSTGSILQTVGAVVQANTTYVLKVTVGARADYPFTGYTAALLAGNVIVAAGNSATPVGGTFVIDVVVCESGANPPQLGQPLQIFVKSTGTGEADIAAVSLTAQPTAQ
jgi:hypothetical protein